jgi:beta-phosphoglucomutase-like phosphatase (HAD superfamily)
VDRLEAVVFDTDGVLTDTASVHATAWKRLFDQYLKLRATRLGELFQAAVMEDALAGVEAGRRGRFALVVGVDRGGQAAALAERGADMVVADLGELVLERASVPWGDR